MSTKKRIAVVLALLAAMLVGGTCLGAAFLHAQRGRGLVIVTSESVFRAEDSLAALAMTEYRERAGCLLGFFSPADAPDSVAKDSIIIPTLWEPPYIDSLRRADGIVFGCPRMITMGTWHVHLPPLMPPIPAPTDWCRLSTVDSVTDRWYVRAGVHLFHISAPGVGRCAWWMSPDGRLTKLKQP